MASASVRSTAPFVLEAGTALSVVGAAVELEPRSERLRRERGGAVQIGLQDHDDVPAIFDGRMVRRSRTDIGDVLDLGEQAVRFFGERVAEGLARRRLGSGH